MKDPEKQFTVEGIIKKLKIKEAPATIYRHVNKLIEENILSTEKVGYYNRLSLNFKNDETLAFLTLIEAKKKNSFIEKQEKLTKKLLVEVDNKLKEIKEIKVVLIFGSYAKGKQKKESDIDIIVLINKRKDLKQIIDNIFHNLSFEFGVSVNPIIITIKDYFDMLKEEKENVGKQSFKDHIIIKGGFEFWQKISNQRTK